MAENDEMPCADLTVAENAPDDAGKVDRNGRASLCVLIAAVAIVELLNSLPGFLTGSDWQIPVAFLSCGTMAVLPFILARLAPAVADFDRKWFPNAWLHWLWFLGMVLLLFVCCEVALLVTEPLGRNVPPFVTFSKTNVILSGIIGVLIGPIAEEIFWRGYVVDQLRKFTRSAVAILLQSLLFALPHLGFANSCYAAFQAFLIGIVLGIWRVRFRSLLPLMLAHMIFNGVVVIPRLVELYGIAEVSEPVAEEMAEFAKNVRSNPKCRQIEALAREPVPKAVPAIIDFFSDPEQPVRDYAGLILTAHFRHDAEPYLKGTLSSRDKNALDVALFVVGMCRYSGLIQEVRDIAWTVDDQKVQISAVTTLDMLDDDEGLRNIAQRHPNGTVRRAAESILAYPSRPKSANSPPRSERSEPSAQPEENPE